MVKFVYTPIIILLVIIIIIGILFLLIKILLVGGGDGAPKWVYHFSDFFPLSGGCTNIESAVVCLLEVVTDAALGI